MNLIEALQRFWRENRVFLLILAAMLGAYLFLRTPSTPVSSVAEIERQLAGGTPVLLEFFSNT